MHTRPAAALLVLSLLAPAAVGEDTPAAPPPAPGPGAPAVRAATWVEGTGDAETLVVALYRAPTSETADLAVGIALAAERARPDYGTVHKADWRTVHVASGEVVTARVALRGRGGASVLVLPHAPEHDMDVHEMIDGGAPGGSFLFARPYSGGPVHVDHHLLRIGETASVRIDAPKDDGFFRDETLEIARVARRLALDGDDPDGPAGSVRMTPQAPAAEDVTLLEGEAGEKRIRGHFEKPDCAWAERHVGWMKDLFVFEYCRPAALTFILDTSEVKAPGVVSDLWKGYGALCWESIWPNGFGGSSSNLTLPAILVVPRDTPAREVTLDR